MPRTETSWKKGQSGNLNGAPKKGYSITAMLKEMLDSDQDIKYKLGKVILEKALEGDIAAIKMLWSYIDGLPRQGLEVSTEDAAEVEHIVRFV